MIRNAALSLSVIVAGASGAVAQDHQPDGIHQVLETPCSVVFDDIYLKDIVDFMTSHYEINIVMDNRVIAPRPGDEQTALDRGEFPTDGFIDHVNVENVTLGEALEDILKPLRLAYAVQDDFIWISTPRYINGLPIERVITRVYHVPSRTLRDVNAYRRWPPSAQQSDAQKHRDLLARILPFSADSLSRRLPPIDIIELLDQIVPDVIDPKSGKVLTYMQYEEDYAQLLVTTSPSNHERIQKILNALIDNQ